MRSMMVFLLFLFSFKAKAAEVSGDCNLQPCTRTKTVEKATDPMPKNLKGTKVIIVQPDGKQSKPLPREAWRVVPRDIRVVEKEVCKEKCAAPQPLPVVRDVAKEVPAEIKHHQLTAYIGAGPDGLEDKEDHEGVTISEHRQWVFGAGYSYRIDEENSLTILGISNKTYLGGYGYSW